MNTKSKSKKTGLVSLVSVSGQWFAGSATVVAWGLDSTGNVRGVVVNAEPGLDGAPAVVEILGPDATYACHAAFSEEVYE